MRELMPAIFFGHGNPMNALSHNAYTEAWAAVGQAIPRPRAVLAVSAHWYIPACAVTANLAPRTIHDFGGFPQELFAVQYPAPGSPELAQRVKDLLAPESVELDESWGLDHGTWSVLIHVFPNADIPIVQLSIDRRQPPAFHYNLGKRLTALREEGVLVIGSGNIVHNLQAYMWGEGGGPAYEWSAGFEQQVRDLLLTRDDARIIDYEHLGPEAQFAVPTPDHYLPLLYILGLREKDEPISFPVEGIEGGSLSMLAVQIGRTHP